MLRIAAVARGARRSSNCERTVQPGIHSLEGFNTAMPVRSIRYYARVGPHFSPRSSGFFRKDHGCSRAEGVQNAMALTNERRVAAIGLFAQMVLRRRKPELRHEP